MDPNDPGNWTGGNVGVGVLKGTKYGISAASYPNVDIANLTLDGAQAIYQSDFWNVVSGDALPWPLACLVFDCAVNQGAQTSKLLLQTSLGVSVDGVIGNKTMAAVAAMKAWDVAHFMTVRVKRYMQSPNFARYGDGWMNRLFEVSLAAGV
jgi:lysozyme family protein